MDVEKMILENEGLVYKAIKDLKIFNDFDEYYSIGMYALCVAANKFDSEFGVKPSTFLYSYIKGYILSEIKRRVRQKERECSLEDGLCFYIEDESENPEMYSTKADPDAIEALKEFIEGLNDRKKDIFCRSTGILGYKKEKQTDLAKEYGTVPTTISSIVRYTKKQLKEYLEFIGFDDLSKIFY